MISASTEATLNVLLVDDDSEDFELTAELVNEIGAGKYKLDWARDYESGLQALKERRHAICLLDHNLGHRTGIEFLQEAASSGCEVPIIVLTGEGGGCIEHEVMAAGATDYLVKGKINADLLWRALRHALERNRALEALRHRDRLFRAVFDTSADAIVVADDSGRYVDANPAAVALFGITREALTKYSVFDLVREQHSARATWEEFLRKGAFFGETELVSAQGNTRILEYSSTANILPGRHVSVLRDVTERRRGEGTRARLAAVVESADDAIIVKDLDGTIREWNPAAERIYGVPAQQAIGSSILQFVPPERVEEWHQLQRKLSEGQKIRNLETARRMHDGRRIDVSLSISPLRDATGSIVGACTITRDITETNKLRARLTIADRMASIGTLAAGVAHEINNPLAAVIANTEAATRELAVLADHPLLENGLREVQASLSDVSEAAGRVRQIVRDLKLFSRPDEERKGAVDISQALETTVRMVWNEIRHRAQLVKEYGETPLVDANDSRLGQVFLNLLVNAAQAIPEGRAHEHQIRIATRTENGRAVVEVSDTGSGIPPEKLERIFEPFFTTKPVGQGTGLGLSIVHGIVTSLGGDISVSSEIGRGTTFRVSLPAGTLKASKNVTPKAPEPALVRRARVLVVDDEVMLIRAIQRTLSRHDVQGVTDAASALKRLQSGESFDVILCDLMMPDMTGMDLHAEVQKFAPDVAARMVFLSGGAFTARARDFLADANRTRMDKPFEPAQLARFVDDVLKQS